MQQSNSKWLFVAKQHPLALGVLLRFQSLRKEEQNEESQKSITFFTLQIFGHKNMRNIPVEEANVLCLPIDRSLCFNTRSCRGPEAHHWVIILTSPPWGGKRAIKIHAWPEQATTFSFPPSLGSLDRHRLVRASFVTPHLAASKSTWKRDRATARLLLLPPRLQQWTTVTPTEWLVLR